MDSDSDLGESSDDTDQKFTRQDDDISPVIESSLPSPDAGEVNDMVVNADLTEDVGAEGPIGVVITPPGNANNM